MLFGDFKKILKESSFMNKINNVNEAVKNVENYVKKTNSENEKLNLASPWEIYRKELMALFESDDDIIVEEILEDETGSGAHDLGIKVYKHRKFEALSKLLPDSVAFGNVTLRIYVYDMENSKCDEPDYIRLFNDLFEGNDIFDEMLGVVDAAGVKHLFAAFKPKAVQFYADNLQDPFGNKTMLAQDVAKDILGPMCESNVQFTSSLISLPEIKE